MHAQASFAPKIIVPADHPMINDDTTSPPPTRDRSSYISATTLSMVSTFINTMVTTMTMIGCTSRCQIRAVTSFALSSQSQTRQFRSSRRWSAPNDSTVTDTMHDNGRHIRREALHLRLQQLGVDADALADAAFRAAATTGVFSQNANDFVD